MFTLPFALIGGLSFRNEVIRRLDEYSAVLVVEHISSEHSGNYTCIASNVAGTERFTVPVTVNVPPKWLLQPKVINLSLFIIEFFLIFSFRIFLDNFINFNK